MKSEVVKMLVLIGKRGRISSEQIASELGIRRTLVASRLRPFVSVGIIKCRSVPHEGTKPINEYSVVKRTWSFPMRTPDDVQTLLQTVTTSAPEMASVKGM